VDTDPADRALQPGPSAPLDGPVAGDLPALAERFLTALLTTAQNRGVRAAVSVLQPPLTVVSLPDQAGGVVLYDRGQATTDQLQAELDRLLGGQGGGLLYLVVCGGDEADLPVLKQADRRAPDPKRLGVYQLSASSQLRFVAGRRLGLLPEAQRLLASVTRPLDRAELVAGAQRAQRAQEEALAFSMAMEKRPQTATRVLGAACIIYYALSVYWGNRGNFTEALVLMGANSAPLVEAGQWWRLLSYAFLHGSLIHLLVNMVALWSFGGFLEGLLGWRRYLLLYGLSALAGGVGSALVARVDLSVGASGAIWGLMAAGVALVRRGHTPLPEVVAGRLRPRLMGVLVVNVGFSLLPLLLPEMPRIDLYAHAGGGLIGFLLVASGLLTRGLGPVVAPAVPAAPELPAPAGPTSVGDPTFVRVAAIVMILLLVGSVAVALVENRPWEPLGIFQAARG
jgi:membrane associated rhomboid family serine protease